eukprot:2087407-Prorocentrum_lima.AAC.1
MTRPHSAASSGNPRPHSRREAGEEHGPLSRPPSERELHEIQILRIPDHTPATDKKRVNIWTKKKKATHTMTMTRIILTLYLFLAKRTICIMVRQY